MKKKKFWQFKAATEDKPAELLLYGEISSSSWWGDEVTPKQFKEDLDALGDVSEIKVFINSPGGDVFAGQAIRSMLKRHKAYKIGYVDGLAASIASVILTACDQVIMPKNAMQMIHKAWTFAIGNADDLRKMADDMDKIDESIIAAYEEKTGLGKEKILEMMEAETWMTAEECVAHGFADEIEDAKQVAASLDNGTLVINGQQMDLSRFKNPPKFAFIPREVEGQQTGYLPLEEPETPGEPQTDPENPEVTADDPQASGSAENTGAQARIDVLRKRLDLAEKSLV